MRSRGVTRAPPSPIDDRLRRWCQDICAAEDPRTVGKRVDGVDLAAFSGEPQCLLADAEKLGRPGQVQPRFDAVHGGWPDRNAMVGTQRRYAFAGPAITVAGAKIVAVENACNEIVVGDAYQQSDGGDDVGRGTVALATAASRQTNLGVDSAHPMNEENDLGRRVVDIGDDLLDDGSHDALLEARVGGLSAPSGFKIRRQCGEGGRLPLWMHGCCRVADGDAKIDDHDAATPVHPQRKPSSFATLAADLEAA